MFQGRPKRQWIQDYLLIWDQQEKERSEKIAAMPNCNYTAAERDPQEIEIEYLWTVFKQTILQQAENVLDWIKSKDDRCSYYNSFNFSKWHSHLYAVSDETMNNNWHWPFQIDLFQILGKQAIASPLHSISRYTVFQVDSVTWWSNVNFWYKELAEKYRSIAQIQLIGFEES